MINEQVKVMTKLEEMKAARSERLHGLVKKYNKWKAALKRIKEENSND
jgi:hypothetical protein